VSRNESIIFSTADTTECLEYPSSCQLPATCVNEGDNCNCHCNEGFAGHSGTRIFAGANCSSIGTLCYALMGQTKAHIFVVNIQFNFVLTSICVYTTQVPVLFAELENNFFQLNGSLSYLLPYSELVEPMMQRVSIVCHLKSICIP